MKLSELDPRFLKIESGTTFTTVGIDKAHADGIMFLCPKCFAKNEGPRGTHSIICWQPHVPQTIHPTPGRWKFEGIGFEDLTLVADSSSILLSGGCEAHFFIRDGQIC